MKKIINVKHDKKGNAYLDVNDLKDLIDIKKITHYSMEVIHDEDDIGALLKFYDKSGNVVNVKEKKK